jgi:hypothetical protein
MVKYQKVEILLLEINLFKHELVLLNEKKVELYQSVNYK